MTAPAGSSDRSGARARPAASLRAFAPAGQKFPGSGRCGRATLAPPRFFEIALLHRRERRRPSPRCRLRRLLTSAPISSTLPFADERCRANVADRHDAGFHHQKIDRAREPDRLLKLGRRANGNAARADALAGARLAHMRPMTSARPAARPPPGLRRSVCGSIRCGSTRPCLRPAVLQPLRTAGSDDPA